MPRYRIKYTVTISGTSVVDSTSSTSAERALKDSLEPAVYRDGDIRTVNIVENVELPPTRTVFAIQLPDNVYLTYETSTAWNEALNNYYGPLLRVAKSRTLTVPASMNMHTVQKVLGADPSLWDAPPLRREAAFLDYMTTAEAPCPST